MFKNHFYHSFLSRRVAFFLLVFVPSLVSSFALFWGWNALSKKYVGSLLAQEFADGRQFDQFLKDQEQSMRQSVLGQAATPSLSPVPTLSLSPTVSPAPRKKSVPSSAPSSYVTESQLWEALSIYRQEQNRTSLVHEESLCAYARSRIKELQQRFTTLKAGDPPLDAHAGFKRDADSGVLFSQTGFSSLAENLAYLPGYKTATQIIEWGWDSSSSHREAQLGNEWTHACVVGTYPFYAALFAHR